MGIGLYNRKVNYVFTSTCEEKLQLHTNVLNVVF